MGHAGLFSARQGRGTAPRKRIFIREACTKSHVLLNSVHFATYGLRGSFLSAAGPRDSSPETDLYLGDVQQVVLFDGIWPREHSQEQVLEISRRAMQFLGLQLLCSPSYEGFKVHRSKNDFEKHMIYAYSSCIYTYLTFRA